MWSVSFLHKASNLGGKGRSGRSATAEARHFPLPSFSARRLGKTRWRAGADLLFRSLKFPEGPAVSWPRKPRSSSRASEGSALRRAALWNTEFNRKLGRERIPDQACILHCLGGGTRKSRLRFRHKTATRQAAPSSNLDFRKDFGAGECTATGCAGDPELLLPFFCRSAKAMGTDSRFLSYSRARQRAS